MRGQSRISEFWGAVFILQTMWVVHIATDTDLNVDLLWTFEKFYFLLLQNNQQKKYRYALLCNYLGTQSMIW